MSSNQEFTESWQRLDLAELNAIAILARSAELMTVCRKMAYFLAECLECEAKHREHFAVKPDQFPAWDQWSDAEMSDAYFSTVMIERAATAGSEKFQEWAELLRQIVCMEMSSRLTVRDVMKGQPCRN
jgi:hypothetical protein